MGILGSFFIRRSFFIGCHGTKSFGRKSPSILKVNAFP